MPVFSSLKKAAGAAALAALLTAAGCSTPQTPAEDAADATAGVRPDLSKLYEAPEKLRASCVSEAPLSVHNTFEAIRFDCPQLAVKANVIEMYDAGWRIEAVDVGEDSAGTDGVKAMPLTITIHKIF